VYERVGRVDGSVGDGGWCVTISGERGFVLIPDRIATGVFCRVDARVLGIDFILILIIRKQFRS